MDLYTQCREEHDPYYKPNVPNNVPVASGGLPSTCQDQVSFDVHTDAIVLFSLLSLCCSLQRTVIFSVVFAIKSDLSVDNLWSWQMLVVNDVAAEHLICDILAVYIWGFPQYIFRLAAFKYLMSLWYCIVLTVEVVTFTSLFWHLVWTYTLFLRLVYPVIFCFWMSADCFVLHALLLFFAGSDTSLLPWWYGSVMNNCQGRGRGAFWRDTVDWTVWSTLSSLVL